MNPILRNILAVLLGIFIGGAVNMAIIKLSGYIISPPQGVDVTTTEGLKAAIHLFEPKHFIMPFLAHALGSFIGALIAALVAINHNMRFALGISIWFMLGGLMMVIMLPSSPLWFTMLDLVVAYIPMGYLGGKLAMRRK